MQSLAKQEHYRAGDTGQADKVSLLPVHEENGIRKRAHESARG